MKEHGGKTGGLVGLDQKQGSDPHSRAIVWVRGETLKAESETADLWHEMEWEWDSPCCSHTHPGWGCSSWELVFRDCGAIPGRGLLMTTERCVEGIWGRRLRWEISSVEESQQPWKQDYTAESHVVGGAITIASLSPHANIGSWTIERLAYQTPDALNYRAGPHPGCHFKCLMCWSTE